MYPRPNIVTLGTSCRSQTSHKMNTLPKHPILEFNPDVLVAVRRKCNLDKPEDVNKAIDILQDWLRQQKYIMHSNKLSRSYLERVLISQKGSIERAKNSIDRLCTIRSMLPRFFETNDIRDIYKQIAGKFCHALLPKQTKDHYRIYIPQILRNGFTSEMIFLTMQLAGLYSDYYKVMDYSSGVIVISDFTRLDIVSGMKAINIVDVRQAVTVFIDGFHFRMKSIHFISPSTAVDLFVTFMKSIINKKLTDRIHVHKNFEELHEFVPKELLPADFGGELKPLPEYFDDWVNLLGSDNNIALLEEIRKVKTDENQRSIVKFNEQYMGMAGSFRTLTLD